MKLNWRRHGRGFVLAGSLVLVAAGGMEQLFAQDTAKPAEGAGGGAAPAPLPSLPDEKERAKMVSQCLKTMKDFKETGGPFSSKYPEPWVLDDSKAPMIFRASVWHGIVNVNVTREDLPAGTKPAEYSKAITESVQQAYPNLNLKVISSDDCTVGGVPARRTIQSLEMGRPDGKPPVLAQQMAVCCIKDTKGYTFTATTSQEWFTQFEPVFKKVIESAKL